MKYKTILYLIIFTFQSAHISGQIKEFTFNLDKEIFEPAVTNFPFDEPFTIKIHQKDVYSIQPYIKIEGYSNLDRTQNYNEHWHYRLLKKTEEEGYIINDEMTSSNGNFKIVMDALHPNELYKMKFKITKKVNFTEVQVKKNNDEILSIINNHMAYNSHKPFLRDQMHQEVGDKFKSYVMQDKVYFKVGNGVQQIDPTQIHTFTPYTDIFEKSIDLNTKINEIWSPTLCGDNTDGHRGLIHQLVTAYNIFLENIGTQYLNKIEMNAEFLNEKVNTFVSTTAINKDLFRIIKRDTAIDSQVDYIANTKDLCYSNALSRYVSAIFIGKAKIEGNLVLQAKDFDMKSGKLLLSFLNNTASYVSGNQLTDLRNLISLLEEWTTNIKEYDAKKLELVAEQSKSIDLFSNLYTNSYASTFIDVNQVIDSKESPYIGLDFGLLVAPKINSTFVFEGFNFHIKPVNRNAKYKDLQGIDEILKRTSIFFGVAQRVNNPDDTFDKKFSIGSPFAGFAVRASRQIRLGVGGIWYNLKDENPIITDTTNELTYFISASLDVKLKDAISVFSKLYNL